MKPKSILLIEDDEFDVITVQRSIGKLNIDIELRTAYNGEEALKLLNLDSKSKYVPDLILLDLNMPRMNGVEFLKAMKEYEHLQELKVYVMTTSTDPEDRKASEELGVSGFLIKPLNFNENSKKNSSMEYFIHFQLIKILQNL